MQLCLELAYLRAFSGFSVPFCSVVILYHTIFYFAIIPYNYLISFICYRLLKRFRLINITLLFLYIYLFLVKKRDPAISLFNICMELCCLSAGYSRYYSCFPFSCRTSVTISSFEKVPAEKLRSCRSGIYSSILRIISGVIALAAAPSPSPDSWLFRL